MNHLVILHKPYLDMILAGTKTVESRLSRRRHPAATRCHAGDVLYLKQKGGDVRARATVAWVQEYADIPPGGVAELAREWAPRVVGGGSDDPYWLAKRDARFALFIGLADVRPCHVSARLFPRTLAWASGWIAGWPTEDVLAVAGSGTLADAGTGPKSRRMKHQLLSFAGAWRDLDADRTIGDLFRARRESPPGAPPINETLS